jgi:hypothetical protein
LRERRFDSGERALRIKDNRHEEHPMSAVCACDLRQAAQTWAAEVKGLRDAGAGDGARSMWLLLEGIDPDELETLSDCVGGPKSLYDGELESLFIVGVILGWVAQRDRAEVAIFGEGEVEL